MDASCAAFDATLARKSLISNGPSFSYLFGDFKSLSMSISPSPRSDRNLLPHDNKMIKTMPQIVSRVLPTA